MRRFYLHPEVHAAFWGDDLILFDVRSGRYHMMAGLGRMTRLHWHGGAFDIENSDAADVLETEGFFFRQPQPANRSSPPPPSSSALAEMEPPSKGSRRAIMRAYWDTIALYHGRPLPFLFRHARAPESRFFKGSAVSLARAFEAASPWLPAQGACVFRSFMLMRLLSRAGVVDLHWVFGVRTWPFHAHCWVQQGDLVLSDYVEALVGYIPIFSA